MSVVPPPRAALAAATLLLVTAVFVLAALRPARGSMATCDPQWAPTACQLDQDVDAVGAKVDALAAAVAALPVPAAARACADPCPAPYTGLRVTDCHHVHRSRRTGMLHGRCWIVE